MVMRRGRGRKPKGLKRVSYRLITNDTEQGKGMYALLRRIVDTHHEEVAQARIALAWCTSWKADADGVVTIGKCKKASELDRELAAYDFIILLSKAFWTDPSVSDHQREALLDHELCHAAVKVGVDGEPEVDERGRTLYRLRKHDLEEFAVVVERHGLYKRDLAKFAGALRRAALQGYTPCEQCKNSPGWLEDSRGTVVRCECYQTWRERAGA